MKPQLKYLKLFEGISPSDIPYVDNQKTGDTIEYIIKIQHSELTELPEIYNQLTNEIGYIFIAKNKNLKTINNFYNLTEIGGYISIYGNPNLTHITGFNNLTEIGSDLHLGNNQNLTHISGFNNLTEIGGYISIQGNKNLTYITGFDNLTKHGGTLCVRINPKLISMSIPYTIIKSVDYVERGIYCGIYYTSPVVFINHPNIVNECIDRFDPSIHPDIVVKQIIENLEVWGEPETIKTILDHILSKGDYWDYIPYTENFKEYHHLYKPKYKNTGARGIAKMNTGRYLGMF